MTMISPGTLPGISPDTLADWPSGLSRGVETSFTDTGPAFSLRASSSASGSDSAADGPGATPGVATVPPVCGLRW